MPYVLISTGRSWKNSCMTSVFVATVNCSDFFLTFSSPFEHEHTMKRRLDDQEIVYAPQQQQPRRPQIQGIPDNLQLSLPTSVVETGADNMQPSTGIQYTLPQGYQVCKLVVVAKKTLKLCYCKVFFISKNACIVSGHDWTWP